MLRHLLAGKRGDDFRHAIEAEFPSVTNDEYNDALRGAWTAASEIAKPPPRRRRRQATPLTQHADPHLVVKLGIAGGVTLAAA